VLLQRGALPPPHSSENSSFFASLLKVAECQKDMFESLTTKMRRGFFTSLMSNSRP
jgi:hypothetical protein